MSKKMTLVVADAVDATATGAAAAVRCNATPFFGGQGHNAFLTLPAAVGGSGVVKIQGHASPAETAPASDDEGWADIVSLDADSPLRQEIEVPAWIRANVTTAGTGTVTVNLEGVQ